VATLWLLGWTRLQAWRQGQRAARA
jgi:hypothetical protein